MPALHELRFRSSPHIDLVLLGDLTAEQREPFRELENDPGFCGLFVARPPLTMNLKSVQRPAAELFRTLAAPAQLGALLDDDAEREEIIDLVLDGILEVEIGDAFVCGADAFPFLCGSPGAPEARDAAARLSREALLHAEDLETADPQELIAALYSYNRIPMSAFWRARFPTHEAVLAHLGADRGSLHALLGREFRAWNYDGAKSWLGWSSKAATQRSADDVTWKLYVSPRPERIRDAFAITARVLSAFPGTAFKIGDSAAGLLRPDKLVTYFLSRSQLEEAASELRRELAGCEAHGVPFTAGLEESGLLSWGVDPPDSDRALSWLQRESWRLWVVQRLGAALSMAKSARSTSAPEPWRFAMERARRQGVDVATWTPSAALWSTA
jgi:hypothetical protein